MSRRFIATVVATALAVTALGMAPARANDNLARTLAAIVGVAIVGKVISDHIDDKNKVSRHATDHARYAPPVKRKFGSSVNHVEPRPLPRKVRQYLLPGVCLRSFDTRDGRYRVFGKSCLKENYDFPRSLPQECEVTFRASKKKRRGYDARCLRRAGYQLART